MLSPRRDKADWQFLKFTNIGDSDEGSINSLQVMHALYIREKTLKIRD